MSNTFYERPDDIEYMQGEKYFEEAKEEIETKVDEDECIDVEEVFAALQDIGNFRLEPKCFDCPIMTRCYEKERELRFWKIAAREYNDNAAHFADVARKFKNRFKKYRKKYKEIKACINKRG